LIKRGVVAIGVSRRGFFGMHPASQADVHEMDRRERADATIENDVRLPVREQRFADIDRLDQWDRRQDAIWRSPSGAILLDAGAFAKFFDFARVPLSSAAMALLAALPRDGAIVVPGRTHDAQLSDMSLTAVLRRMGRGDITIHGFRSTFRDWCAEAPGNAFPREVCEHALAHSLPNRVEAAYRRGDLLDKRILLMQAWSDYCMSQPATSD
jgi:hypothetical protein